ncbi:MAG: ribonuclease P protein component [Hyphomicrobiaceae bacterium]|nr:ribonuclease P protein component [Hyphomicrobiaceae bacterium]
MPAGEHHTPFGRLKKRADYLRVRGGRSWRSGSLVLQARRRTEQDDRFASPPRFGFTATRRIGTAVARNRARRRLKETVRRIAQSHARPGYDYVVIARRGALTRSFTNMQKDLEEAFSGVHKEQKTQH